MARAIKYQTQFKSISNLLYTVNIYVDGWTGSITTLTPAAEPLEIQEDDDGDLLNVLRYQTGYVRVMTQRGVDMADIIPIGLTDRYVEVLEGQTLIFRGFVQPQELCRTYEFAATGNIPEEMEIPIISPLGLAADLEFDKITNISDMTLYDALKQSLLKMNGDVSYGYSQVYFPNVTSDTALLKTLRMPTTIISPFSDDHGHTSSLTINECFKVQTIDYFIEGLCRCFGLMVHDTPTALVFTRVQSIDSYTIYNLTYDTTSQISAPGDMTFNPSNVFDGEILISQKAPLHQLTCNYDGDRETHLELDYQQCIRRRSADYWKDWYLVTCEPVITAQIYAPYRQSPCTISRDHGIPLRRGTYFIAYGEENLEEMILICFDGSDGHAWAAGDELFRYTFFGYFGVDMTLNFAMKFGVNMNFGMEISSGDYDRKVNVYIKCGTKYLNSSGSWVTTKTVAKEVTVTDMISQVQTPLSIAIPSTGMNAIPITVIFEEYNFRDTYGGNVLAITNLSLDGEESDPATQYVNEGSNPGQYVLKGNGVDDQDIDIAFACYGQKNSHMLFPYISFSRPTYPYMFRQRKEISIGYKASAGGSILPYNYLCRYQFKGEYMRVISQSYSARDEVTRLTMQTINS